MSKACELLVAMIVVLGVLAFTAVPALAAEQWSIVATFGGATSTPPNPQPLSGPAWVAVNQSTTGAYAGDVYVVDKGNNRVEYFSATGEYKGQFNGSAAPTGALSSPGTIAIDNSPSASDPSKEDVYVEDTGHHMVDKFTANGAYLGQFATGTEPTAGVVVDSSGDVWVLSVAGEVNGTLQEFSDGAPNTPLASLPLETKAGEGGWGYLARAIAVNPEGDFYLVARGGVTEFNHEAKLIEQLPGFLENSGTSTGLAVDLPGNDVYIDSGVSLTLAAPVTGSIETFGAGPLTAAGGIAEDAASGDVYVAEPASDRIFIFEHSASSQIPPPAPVTEAATEVSSTSWTLNGSLNPGGVTDGVGYYFSYNAGAGSSCTGPGSVLTPFDSGMTNVTGNTSTPVSATVKLHPREEYAFCLVADKYGATVGPQLTLIAGPEKPEVIAGSEHASSTSLAETEFTATINPENEETTYWFEYSTEGSLANNELTGTIQTDPAEPFPTLPAAFGEQPVAAGGVPLGVTESVYYRVVAQNATGTVHGKVQVYTKLPSVEQTSVSAVTSLSARLEATVYPDFFKTEYTFEYAAGQNGKDMLEQGEGTLVPNSAGTLPGRRPEPEEELSLAPTPVIAEFIGLQPGEIYYYRTAVQNLISDDTQNANEGKPVDSAIQSFTTFAAPTAITGQAQNITETSATLAGEVNPQGEQTKYSFEYMSETAYLAALAEGAPDPLATGETTTPHSAGAGTVIETVGPAPAAGLLPEETYRYRLQATNTSGVQGTGSEATFTTQGSSGAPPLVLVGKKTGGSTGTTQTPTGPYPLTAPTTATLTFPTGDLPTDTEEHTTTEHPKPPLTNKQKLAKALKACKKDKNKRTRHKCEQTARKRYKAKKHHTHK